MRITTICSLCQSKQPVSPKVQFIYAEPEDDVVWEAECPAGHKVRLFWNQLRFESLLEMGGLALLDGYYREAVSSFATALERFFELYIRVILDAHGIQNELAAQTWKTMSAQSERQLGAFLVLHLLDTGQPVLIDQEKVRFRNEVVHKGHIPSRTAAFSYAKWVFDFISSAGKTVKKKHKVSAYRVATHLASSAYKKIKEKKGLINLQMSCLLLHWHDDSWEDVDFDVAMKALEKRRNPLWFRYRDGSNDKNSSLTKELDADEGPTNE